MILIGLTGGTGCGKSRVAAIFRQLGGHIIDADEVARDVVRPGKPALKKIRAAFGKSILTSNNSLDRKKLGNIIFLNPKKRSQLNQIIHPYIFREEERRRKQIFKRSPGAVVIFDAALLIETGSYQLMDRNILVTADRNTQLTRIMERDGLSRKEALGRIRAQWPSYRKKKFADYVLDGRLPAGKLKVKVRKIYKELKALSRVSTPLRSRAKPR
ncbi:MAG TPA: dephospho-CoA kinase [Nitrospiria bacterium]